MKMKSFQEYLEKRLNTDEISELERQAEFEYESLKSLQDDVSSVVQNYMFPEAGSL